ncbi:HNH endonuclease [Streptomyces sp. G2]|uniref:HNH endonuclease n=1 Tax=Streptomyces sp. G2 TaxID=1684471 RepID=UPI0020306C6D|nr:HNH endonuclease [Streptomyces sp. G2]MCM1946398.1 HNH endonuclease [Streptomyces sp. G2]
MANVDIRAGWDACWPWTGKLTEKGYGEFQVNGKKRRAHRWIVERTLGYELERDEFVCHTCDTRACCNPRHLFVGDAGDNNRDCVAKGRHSRGFYGNQYARKPDRSDEGRASLLVRLL